MEGNGDTGASGAETVMFCANAVKQAPKAAGHTDATAPLRRLSSDPGTRAEFFIDTAKSESQVQVPVSTDTCTPGVGVQASKRLEEQGSAPIRPNAP